MIQIEPNWNASPRGWQDTHKGERIESVRVCLQCRVPDGCQQYHPLCNLKKVNGEGPGEYGKSLDVMRYERRQAVLDVMADGKAWPPYAVWLELPEGVRGTRRETASTVGGLLRRGEVRRAGNGLYKLVKKEDL